MKPVTLMAPVSVLARVSSRLAGPCRLLPGPEETAALHEALVSREADAIACDAAHHPFPLRPDLEVAALVADPASRSHTPERGIVIVTRRRRPDLRVLLHPWDARARFGKVWIAGFGPGDPDLMTFRTDRLLRRADVILHDDLIDARVLKRYAGRAEYVGKRKMRHAAEQDEINERTCRAALEGQRVVRLKGGDPFLFGRGGEEAEFFRRRFVPVEVVPGVSAANAAAAAAGIPLTRRGISSSVGFRTLHGAAANRPVRDGCHTLVYFMGATCTADLSRDLIREGVPPDTPVALIRHASEPGEEIVRTNARALEDVRMESPVIIIVGETARSSAEERNLLFMGTDADLFLGDGRLVRFPEGVRARPEAPVLDRFDGVVFSSAEDVDRFTAVYGSFPGDLLCLAADEETADRVRRLGGNEAHIILGSSRLM